MTTADHEPATPEKTIPIPRLPLQVCFYSPPNVAQRDLILRLEAELAGDPPGGAVALTRPAVPTRLFWTPEPVPWDEAETTVVLAFIDQYALGTPTWRSWVEARAAEAGPGDPAVVADRAGEGSRPRRVVVPVALDPAFTNLDLAGLHAVHLLPAEPTFRDGPVRLLHHIWRELRGERRARLFVSYAAADGRPRAEAIQQYLANRTHLEPLFDRVSLLEGGRFDTQIEQQLASACALIVVLTDAWSGRPWCQRELLFAKSQGVPVVVIDALERGVPRAFPYLGNGLTLRWTDDLPELLHLVMLEATRDAFVDRHLEVLRAAGWLPPGADTLDRAPELATLERWARQPELVHPDPPLAQHEHDLLKRVVPTTRVRTPTQALMRGANERPLTGRRLALSISDPPHEELTRLGLSTHHIRRAWLAVARHLLAAGAGFDYSGDFRDHGFTWQLVDLIQAHRQAQMKVEVPVTLQVPWPISEGLTPEVRSRIPSPIQVVGHPLPPDVPWKPGTSTDPTTREARFAWARALTETRLAVTAATDARVLLGGAWIAKGRIPGLAEEALLHLEAGKPLYLLGGFGGMTAALAAAVQGREPKALTNALQLYDDLTRDAARDYNTWVDALPADAPVHPTVRMRVDYPDLVQRFAQRGPGGLNNGLSAELNLRLMATRDLTEAIGLVLYGLQCVVQ